MTELELLELIALRLEFLCSCAGVCFVILVLHYCYKFLKLFFGSGDF